jgi:membrane-associated phospholipid phosphatase
VKEILQQTRIFLILFVCYIIILGYLLATTAKGDFEIWLNSFHTDYFDTIFYWTTYIGDGFFAAVVLVFILLFVNIRISIISTAILLAVSAVTQILKLFVFPSSFRPIVFFKDVVQLHFVNGLDIHSSNSFPSGHTTQAFCMFFLFSFFMKNRKWNYVFFFIALLVAISRVYLLQHFLKDVYVGAIIGTIGSLGFLYLTNHYQLLSNPILNQPLIKKK